MEACSLIDTAALPQYKLPGCMHFNAVERELIAGTKGGPILALCIHTAAIANSLSVQSACILVLQTEVAYYGFGLMSDVGLPTHALDYNDHIHTLERGKREL